MKPVQIKFAGRDRLGAPLFQVEIKGTVIPGPYSGLWYGPELRQGDHLPVMDVKIKLPQKTISLKSFSDLNPDRRSGSCLFGTLDNSYPGVRLGLLSDGYEHALYARGKYAAYWLASFTGSSQEDYGRYIVREFNAEADRQEAADASRF